MNDTKRPEVDPRTVATGCTTGCAGTFLQIVLVAAVLAATKNEVIPEKTDAITFGISMFGLITSLGVSLAIGYVTAKVAPRMRMVHALVVGGLWLLFCLAASVHNYTLFYSSPFLPSQAISLWGSLPMTLLGAQRAIWGSKPGIDSYKEPESSS